MKIKFHFILVLAAQIALVLFGSTLTAQTIKQIKGVEVRKNTDNNLQLVNDNLYSLQIRSSIGEINEIRTVNIGQEGSFADIYIKDYQLSRSVGAPRLPQRIEIIEIPQNASIEIIYNSKKYKDIDLDKLGVNYPIHPAQAPVSKSSKGSKVFAYDKELYATRGFYKAAPLVKVELMGESRGVRLAKLIISPIQYNYKTNKLRVYSDLDFEIKFIDADINSTKEKKAKYKSQAFELLNSASLNTAFLDIKESSKTVTTSATDRPMKYVIVSDEKFRATLQRFIQWKTIQGFEVVEAYTSDSEVGKTTTSIRSYLKSLYDNANAIEVAPTYILFVGDVEQIPSFDSKEHVDYATHITDFYYVEYTGDMLPDAFTGRFSAQTIEELIPQIDKTIQMDSISLENASFLSRSFLISGTDRTYGESHLNAQLNYGEKYYFNQDQGIKLFKYPYPLSENKTDEIIEEINKGASIITFSGHGLSDGWYDPNINSTNMQKITNANKYPLMIGNCCLTGKFDDDVCFGEDLLRSENKGAVVYIGGTNSTYFDEDFYWAIGAVAQIEYSGKDYTYEETDLGVYDRFFHIRGEKYSDWATNAAEFVYWGNMAVEKANSSLNKYYWEVYQIFGDPSYMPYKNKPTIVKFELKEPIYEGDKIVELNTEKYARVSITYAGELLGIAIADSNGFVSIAVDPIVGVESLDIYVMAQFKRMTKFPTKILGIEGKYIYVSEISYVGNVIEEKEGFIYGETYGLNLLLDNIGKESINTIKIEISSNNSIFIPTTSTYTHTGELKVGESLRIEDKLSFQIDKDAISYSNLKYTIKITMDGDKVIEQEESKLLYAPKFEILTFSINDENQAQPNNVLDEGETVTSTITIYNSNEVEAADCKLTISSDKAYINILDKEFDLGNIAPKASKEVSFKYRAESSIMHDVYKLKFDIDSKGRIMSMDTFSYITPILETFETGDFTYVAWDTLNIGWEISEERAYAGKYCAASKKIDDGEEAVLSIEIQTLMDDKVSFYYRTSTEVSNEVYGDFLRFYINGVLQGSWVGIMRDWAFASYDLSKGKHILTWKYIKDETGNGGSDKVWIDNVYLPIGTTVTIADDVSNEGITQHGKEDVNILSIYDLNENNLQLKFNSNIYMQGNLYMVNSIGKKVAVLGSNIEINQGSHIYSYSIPSLPPGLYIIVFEPRSVALKTQTAKVVLN